MSESFEPLDVPFSTADSGPPALAYERGGLRVLFRDWRECDVLLLFHDAAAFSWDDGEAACSALHRDDACYTVAGSAWLRRHLDLGGISADDRHRHYKLCFNAAGVLQVLSTRLEVLPRPPDARA